jgi:alpha,alpha-trehalose phosphorylase
VITHPAFTTEPWCVRESELHLDVLAQSESVFALSNGHIGLRGNLDEGEPHGLPGTYLNSVYELRQLPYAEAGYGYPESGQTVVNVTNGKIIRLLVDDEPFDVRYGTLHTHERFLDLRSGILTRSVLWSSPTGCTVRITSKRLVSFVKRSIAAIWYEVEPVDDAAPVVVQSELIANESIPNLGSDPRSAAALEAPLVLEENSPDRASAVMVHHTRVSRLRVAACMGHEIRGPEGMLVEAQGSGEVSRLTIAAGLRPGTPLQLVKYLAYGWSGTRSRPALHDQVVAALAAARLAGWDGLVAAQREFLDEFWADADVEVDGDPEVQQAVRFGLFHVMQAAVRAEQRPIPAKGLTGTGYEGHTFWDTESFVLPVLTYSQPKAAADALRWRKLTLPLAKERADRLGLRGAAFPWRTIRGQESSYYWPASTAAFHINADIADAALRYLDATEDSAFERDTALPLLVATARLWQSLGQTDRDGRFSIDGVTGPDEYSAIADNNTYTNLMAQQNLRAAAELCGRHVDLADKLGVTPEECMAWRFSAASMTLPYDTELGVHDQNEGFIHHAKWDFASTSADMYPLLLHVPYFDLYRKQVIKQADLVLAMHLQPDAFTPEQKERNFAYYEALTVRDSSLSASTQAVLAAEVGQLDLAYDYLGEAALMDLGDLEHNTRDGLHLAALAGAWTSLVAGFGGMRAYRGRLSFCPQLPPALTGLSFRMRYRGRRLHVGIDPDSATYQVLDGEPLEIWHHGEELLVGDQPIRRPTPVRPVLVRAQQPPGREPLKRR